MSFFFSFHFLLSYIFFGCLSKGLPHRVSSVRLLFWYHRASGRLGATELYDIIFKRAFFGWHLSTVQGGKSRGGYTVLLFHALTFMVPSFTALFAYWAFWLSQILFMCNCTSCATSSGRLFLKLLFYVHHIQYINLTINNQDCMIQISVWGV